MGSLALLLRGQHFYNGVRIASGVLGIALAGYAFLGLTPAAILATGALSASLADMPSPISRKPYEMLVVCLLSSVLFALVGLLHPHLFLFAPFLLVVSFFIAYLSVFGKRMTPIIVAAFFSIVMAIGSSVMWGGDLVPSATIFAIGTTLYSLYSVISSFFFVSRTKQQVFADCTIALSNYLRLKARMYEKGANLDQLYPSLISRQAEVAELWQSTRDFIFSHVTTDDDRLLAKLFSMQVDFFEALMASDTDYVLLQSHYGGADILHFMRDVMFKSAKKIEGVAHQALYGSPPPYNIRFKAELFAIEFELERLSHDRTQDPAILSELVNIFEKMIVCTTQVDAMWRLQRSPYSADEHDVRAAIKIATYKRESAFTLKAFTSNFRFGSPHFRYAIRTAVAMEVGYLCAIALNHFSDGAVTRSYWILLTISSVMRANFSATVQRRTDRIIGTVAGCFAGAALLSFPLSVPIIMGCIFVSKVASSALSQIDYRKSSAAASITALMQITLLNPGIEMVLWERMLDTVIGAFIAYLGCFVMPSWEARQIPQRVKNLAKANARYTRAVLTFGINDDAYRADRDAMIDALAELSGAFSRMQREPATKRYAMAETGRYLSLNYLFSARIAAIGLLMARLEERPAHGLVVDQLQAAQKRMERLMFATSTILSDVPHALRPKEAKIEEEDEPLLHDSEYFHGPGHPVRDPHAEKPLAERSNEIWSAEHGMHPVRAGAGVRATILNPLEEKDTEPENNAGPEDGPEEGLETGTRESAAVFSEAATIIERSEISSEFSTDESSASSMNPDVRTDVTTGADSDAQAHTQAEDKPVAILGAVPDADSDVRTDVTTGADSETSSGSTLSTSSDIPSDIPPGLSSGTLSGTGPDIKEYDSHDMDSIDYSEQHVLHLLQKQLDAAIDLVKAIGEVEKRFIIEWDKNHMRHDLDSAPGGQLATSLNREIHKTDNTRR